MASSLEGPSNKTINFIWIQPVANSTYANLENGSFVSGSMAHFFQSNMLLWKQLNPDWATRLWDSHMCAALVESRFPVWVELYESVGPVCKADLARLMILLTYAGVYSDLDSVPSKSLDDILTLNSFNFNQHNTALFLHQQMEPADVMQTSKFPIREGTPEISKRISLGLLFAARRSASILERTLALSFDRLSWIGRHRHRTDIDWADDYTIVWSTGPDAISEAVFRSNTNGEETSTPPFGVLVVPPETAHVVDAGTTTWKGRSNPGGFVDTGKAADEGNNGRQNPSKADALNNLANSLQTVGRIDEAVTMFGTVVQLDPTHAGAFNNLGVALGKLRRMKEASQYLKKSTELDRSSPATFMSLAITLKAQRRLDEARGALEQALALKPDHASAALSLGGVLKTQGRFARSCEVFGLIAAQQPGHEKANAAADIVCAMGGEEQLEGRDVM